MDDGWMDQSDQKHWCAQGCLQQLLFARRGAVLVCLCLTSRYYLRSIVHPTRSDGRREPFRNLHLFRWDREQVFAARTAREPFFAAVDDSATLMVVGSVHRAPVGGCGLLRGERLLA